MTDHPEPTREPGARVYTIWLCGDCGAGPQEPSKGGWVCGECGASNRTGYLNQAKVVRASDPTPDRVAEQARVHREILQQIASMPTVQRNPDGVDQAAATMQLLAREALDWPASAADRVAEDESRADCDACKGTGHEAEPGPTGEPVSTGPCRECGGTGTRETTPDRVAESAVAPAKPYVRVETEPKEER
jgi:hypothetical protein